MVGAFSSDIARRSRTPDPTMSEKTTRKPDPRAARTRDRLGDALIGLLLSRPFEEITVQSVLDRADVSRSTFYEHYRDKNDLLLSDADEFFAGMSTLLIRTSERSKRVAPVAEFFAHVAQARDLFVALAEAGKIHDLRELGEAHFARGIRERLGPATSPAVAYGLAGALFSLLWWWMQNGMKPSPAEMDNLFHKTLTTNLQVNERNGLT